MIGHLMGAAGSVETIAALRSLVTGTVPPTVGLEEPGEELDLDYVPANAREGLNLNYVQKKQLRYRRHECVCDTWESNVSLFLS